MPTNLIKRYNQLLELNHLGEGLRGVSLRRIFDRDFNNASSVPTFQRKIVKPTPSSDTPTMLDQLFRHLTTTDHKIGGTWTFDPHRSVRLHWVRHHIDQRTPNKTLIFSHLDSSGHRTYLYDRDESYVVILEPLRKVDEYYLITAYYIQGRDKFKIENKYTNRTSTVL